RGSFPLSIGLLPSIAAWPRRVRRQLFQASGLPSTCVAWEAPGRVGSAFDDAGDVWSHTFGPDRGYPHWHSSVIRLQHLAITQIQGDVLAAARSIEDQVTAFRL